MFGPFGALAREAVSAWLRFLPGTVIGIALIWGREDLPATNWSEIDVRDSWHLLAWGGQRHTCENALQTEILAALLAMVMLKRLLAGETEVPVSEADGT